MDSTAPTVESNRTISRRATLAKGTAAGVLVWTTPVVLSTSAKAGTTCTPRCNPAQVSSFSFTITKTCSVPGQSRSLEFAPSAVTYTGATPTTACPCNGTSQTPTSPNVTLLSSNWTLRNGTCPQVGASQTLAPATVGSGFAIDLGSFQNNLCLTGCVRLVVRCQDRNGDFSYRYCDSTVNYSYAGQGNNNCNSLGLIATITPATRTCGGPTCNSAPGAPTCT